MAHQTIRLVRATECAPLNLDELQHWLYHYRTDSEWGIVEIDIEINRLRADLKAAKAENERLQKASYSLVVSLFHSGIYDDYTGKEFREFLTNCGFVEGDVILRPRAEAEKG